MALSKMEQAAAGREILAGLDQDRIREKIRSAPPEDKLGFDANQAAEMVWAACERWLARDAEWMVLHGIEHPYEWMGEHGIIDMFGRFTLQAPAPYCDKTFVRDWKTTGRELDLEWERKYINDWQWKMYLWHTGADFFVYSGVSTRDGGATREIIVPRPADLEEQVMRQMAGMAVLQRALVDAGLDVYPQHMPGGCHVYGECARWEECAGNTMPRQALEEWNWSPTSMGTFLDCPEKFRRNRLDRLAGLEGRGNEAAQQGAAFHRGIAEVYRQVWEIPEITVDNAPELGVS